MKSSLLAVVVPYYKPNFIRDALLSIQHQTDNRFRLYIGDDNSPYPIQTYLTELEAEFGERVHFTRFENNVVSVSLTKQWERCISLTNGEPYIWLFSDDDLMPPDAVERFYAFIDKNQAISLCRFNIEIINGKGEPLGRAMPHPFSETAEQFINRRLAGDCISTACEYIFSRKVYEENGGFVDLPLAWAADDATWATFAKDSCIYTIPGAPVRWRMSGQNISSDKGKSYEAKLSASVSFIQRIGSLFVVSDTQKLTWLQQQLHLLSPPFAKRYAFYKQLAAKGLFTKRFLLSFLGRQWFANLWKRALRKTKRIIQR